MTKVYELPNGHRMIADIDETTRTCTITETQLDSLVSKLNYYAEQTEVLDKIRAEIDKDLLTYSKDVENMGDSARKIRISLGIVRKIINKYTKGEGEC